MEILDAGNKLILTSNNSKKNKRFLIFNQIVACNLNKSNIVIKYSLLVTMS